MPSPKKPGRPRGQKKNLAGPVAAPTVRMGLRQDDNDRSRSEDFSGLKPASFWK